MRPPRLIVIVGPTASGKSDLAVRLAELAGGEVLSADSQQVYRGMDIGTGKLERSTRSRCRHHLIDIADPDDEMTAARFVELADDAIADMAARQAPIIVAGGTMLYVRVLLFGLFDGPGADPAIRARLEAEAGAEGTAALHRRLAEVDAPLAERVEVGDLRRIVRALEVHELTGVPMSEHQRRHDFRRLPPRYPARIVGLRPPREALVARIDRRVDDMMASGFLDEVRRLRRAGYRPPLRSQEAIGYRELHEHLDGLRPLREAVGLIKRNSRRYARRQVSWYRRDERVAWHGDASEVDLADLQSYLRGSRESI